MNIRIGLKGLRVAKLKRDDSAAMSADNTAAVEYEAVRSFKDVQNIDLTVRSQSTDVDADDVTETLVKSSGYDGKVQRTMFTPEEQAMLLGETILDDGTAVSFEDDEAPEYATGFCCKVYGGKVLAMWVPRCKYSAGDLSAETAGTDKLNPQSDTLSFKSMARKCDGMWRIYKVCDSEAEAETFLSLATLQRLYTKATATTNENTPTTPEGDNTPTTNENDNTPET